MRDQLKNDLQGGEGLGSPVERNKGKESVFDLIPFAGGRRIMSHRDREVFFIGKFLEFFLPEPISYPIGATSISCDQEFVVIGIQCFTAPLPPPSDTFHRKLGSIMIDAHVDKSLVMHQIVDTIWYRFAISQRKKVIHIHAGVLSFGLPLPPIVLKGAHQLFFLAINRNNRMTFLLKLLARAVDVGKLCIPIRMRFPLNGLLIDVQREALYMQHLCQG